MYTYVAFKENLPWKYFFIRNTICEGFQHAETVLDIKNITSRFRIINSVFIVIFPGPYISLCAYSTVVNLL